MKNKKFDKSPQLLLFELEKILREDGSLTSEKSEYFNAIHASITENEKESGNAIEVLIKALHYKA